MKNDLIPDDERFMAQFANRLHVEPPPKWVSEQKRAWPWLEVGWAVAATLMLGVYWTELRFGATTLSSGILHYAALIPMKWLVMVGALTYGIGVWLVPKIARELR